MYVCILNIFYCYKCLHFLIFLFCILFESSVPISLTSMIDIMVLFSCKNRKTVEYESNCSVQDSAKQFWMLCLWIHHWKKFVSSCKFSECEEKRGNTDSMNNMIYEKQKIMENNRNNKFGSWYYLLSVQTMSSLLENFRFSFDLISMGRGKGLSPYV